MIVENIIIGLAAVAIGFLYYKFRENVGRQLIIAILISATWIAASGVYTYKGLNIFLGNLNLFPLAMWVAGLVIFKELYDNAFDNITGAKKWPIIVSIWVATMIVIEFIGYNWLSIQLGNGDAGLFGLPLMHMPWWGQLYYFTIGPIYLLITKYLRTG